MVEKTGLETRQLNYNTIQNFGYVNKNQRVNKGNAGSLSFTASEPARTPNPQAMPVQAADVTLRTSLSSKDEKKKYTEVVSHLDRSGKKILDSLLKTGILLNNNSGDKSTVLDNLYKMTKEPRAEGLKSDIMLKDTIAAIAYPYVITQQFGDIPARYRQEVIAANNEGKTNLLDRYKGAQDIDVTQSGTCVAASMEFKLANQMPAEFARFAQELSSPNLSVNKHIEFSNLADDTLSAIWLLNSFEIPWETKDLNTAELKFAPDKKAIIRARIQTTDKDPYERTPLDVLMQSTFMQAGSQQSYNSLTDKRTGKFNQNDKGLIEFEKTFTESVVFDKNILSVTYQTIDENARLVGYETDLETMKHHLLSTLDEGENILIGYTQTDSNNVIINGHEITIVGYRQGADGKVTFICNDTDDNISKAIEYSEDFLLPKIHHAALPKHIVEHDMNIVPSWVEGLEMFQLARAAAQNYAPAA